jgi:periplasmic protein TonB
MGLSSGFEFAGSLLTAWRKPLVRMFLLSLALHVALIMIVQPQRYLDVEEVHVISARLMEPTEQQAEEEVLPPPPTAEDPEPVSSPLAPTLPVEPTPVSKEAVPVPELQKASEPAIVSPTPPPVTESRPPEPSPRKNTGPDLPSVPVMIDTTWYEAKQLDVQPKATAAITPRYPPDAARRSVEGTVKLSLRVDEYGVVREVAVVEGDPPGVFDESALEAFRKARFNPARKEGHPVRAQILIRVRYELDD